MFDAGKTEMIGYRMVKKKYNNTLSFSRRGNIWDAQGAGGPHAPPAVARIYGDRQTNKQTDKQMDIAVA